MRALRELGKDRVGFDHSRHALSQAEELVKPHLFFSSVDDAGFKRPSDLLVALSLFESLTEAQARDFLVATRSLITQGLFAVIHTAKPSDSEIKAGADRDLSHITVRSRGWWHDLFLSAGWRQDPLHRTLQRLCQRQPLPSRMGWEVFVYAAAGPLQLADE